MHVIARPHADIASTFDDVAAVTAAAAASVSVASLSACYAGAHKERGLILGYAGTPEVEIERAIARLQTALRNLY
jgi:GntR family transcriptional regulator/MocR family aminotransferase